jgi:Iron dependent repressor, metal binding and dimerisation domain
MSLRSASASVAARSASAVRTVSIELAIAFTADGATHAEGIVRRHRLIERFLTDILGVPWDEVHEEAERLEHAMSHGRGLSPTSIGPIRRIR